MADLLSFTVPPWELVVRGTVIYVGLVLVVRFVLRRDVGSLGMPDVLFIVLVADAAQNAMAGEYKSIADGIVLLGTLVFWNVALDWIAWRSPRARRLIEPPPMPLVRDGKLQRRNLKREWITPDEVMAKLREQGIDDIRRVRIATLEADGELSVLKRDGAGSDHAPRARRTPGA